MSNFFTILIIAISLSMDTFSLSVAYGMLDLENKQIYKISTMVGVFHFVMPLLGNALGDFILGYLPFNVDTIIGIIFLLLAFELLFSLIKKEEIVPIETFMSMLFFSVSVSLDSFSVGIGLEAVSSNHLLCFITFMIISFLFTFTGLKLGKKINNRLGSKAQVIGTLLLFVLSIKYLLKG